MATDKPRIQGYVPKSVHQIFEEHRTNRALSKSEAIEQAVVALFGLSPSEMKILEEWAHQENRSVGHQALTILQKAIREHQ